LRNTAINGRQQQKNQQAFTYEMYRTHRH
jgi:hypothetical protein